MKRGVPLLAAIAAVLVLVSLVSSRLRHGPPPLPMPGFELTSTDGRIVTLDAYRGRWVLVYFGYTACRGGACTAPLAGMQQAAHARHDVAALFITLDPARDTTLRLAQFVQPFAPEVVGLTGPVDATDAAERAFGVYAVRHDTDAGVHYDRSNLIYVVDPKGQLVGHVDGEAPAGIISSSIGKPAP